MADQQSNDSVDSQATANDGGYFGDILEQNLSRRTTLKMGLAGVVASLSMPLFGNALNLGGRDEQGTATKVVPLTWSEADKFEVPNGYTHDIVVRWGDPITADAPAFDISKQTGEAQSKQFGYNNDFVGYLPLSEGTEEHGILCVSHEYTNPHMMFANYGGSTSTLDKEQINVTMAAHGMTMVVVKRASDGSWSYDAKAKQNWRTDMNTAYEITGPAAGDDYMKTSADKTGSKVFGSLNNCSGGMTPWGTYLQAEENIHGYFAGDIDGIEDDKLKGNYKRMGIKDKSRYSWEKHYDRFDVNKEPNEPNRFGWVVEIDPANPDRTPAKRTALGRCKHEAATAVISKTGKAVVYSGDDQRFEYVYKFVSKNNVNTDDHSANWGILDEGTLYVARFDEDGSGSWLPLVFGKGPLTEANGFASQADVVIRAREAGTLVGATRMDRPEDVEASPVTGKVYIALTNNSKRKEDDTDASNPRGPNKHGHILELVETDDNHDATTFTWSPFMLCGPLGEGSDYQGHQDISPISCPDNLAFDRAGNLWVSTDGQIKTVNKNDGIYQVITEGPFRGMTRQMASGLPGGEMCGPCFTPDNTTLFCAVQHPGADVKGSTFEEPATRWPDYTDGMPARPSIVAIRRSDNGVVGA